MTAPYNPHMMHRLAKIMAIADNVAHGVLFKKQSWPELWQNWKEAIKKYDKVQGLEEIPDIQWETIEKYIARRYGLELHHAPTAQQGADNNE